MHSPQKLQVAMAKCAVQGLGLSIYSCTSVLTQSINLINHLPLHHRLASRDARHWRQWRAVASVPLGLGNECIDYSSHGRDGGSSVCSSVTLGDCETYLCLESKRQEQM